MSRDTSGELMHAASQLVLYGTRIREALSASDGALPEDSRILVKHYCAAGRRIAQLRAAHLGELLLDSVAIRSAGADHPRGSVAADIYRLLSAQDEVAGSGA